MKRSILPLVIGFSIVAGCATLDRRLGTEEQREAAAANIESVGQAGSEAAKFLGPIGLAVSVPMLALTALFARLIRSYKPSQSPQSPGATQ